MQHPGIAYLMEMCDITGPDSIIYHEAPKPHVHIVVLEPTVLWASYPIHVAIEATVKHNARLLLPLFCAWRSFFDMLGELVIEIARDFSDPAGDRLCGCSAECCGEFCGKQKGYRMM